MHSSKLNKLDAHKIFLNFEHSFQEFRHNIQDFGHTFQDFGHTSSFDHTFQVLHLLSIIYIF